MRFLYNSGLMILPEEALSIGLSFASGREARPSLAKSTTNLRLLLSSWPVPEAPVRVEMTLPPGGAGELLRRKS